MKAWARARSSVPRPQMARLAPSCARRRAVARPIPRDPPVMATTLPLSCRSMGLAHQPGHGAREAGGLADEEALGERQALHQSEPDIANQADRVAVVREQPVQPVRRNSHRHRVEPAPALIMRKNVLAADIEAEPGCIDDAIHERRRIAYAQVQPLARDRVDDMRGVPDEREPLRDEGAGYLER